MCIRDRGSCDWIYYPVAILAVFCLRAILGFIGEYAMAWVANNVVTELRQAMFARMVNLPMGYFTDNLSGRLLSRVTNDVNGVAGAATGALTALIKDSLSIIALLGWLVYLNWKLTLSTFIMVPPIAVAVRFFSKRLRKVARGQQEAMGKICLLYTSRCV